ncbi:MAG: carboxymuconolactone decarboxylase family protein [Actinomycetales bacterium]|nr:carboxymuconolactone decarboxylase family protein [Actinomycetales bacterium]
MTEHYTLTLPLLDLATADEPARTALERGSRSGPFLPNMYRAMANAPGLLDTYLSGYARFREESGFTPQEQEVVFLTISAENGCEYCVAAHSVIADTKSRLPHDVTDALRAGQPLPDSRLDSLSDFTRHFLLERGRPTREAVEAFLSAGYTETHILYIILALSVKTMSNYANHVFDTPVDPVFRAREWKAFRFATKAFQAVTRRP